MTQIHQLITKNCASIGIAVTAVLFAACGKDDSADQALVANKPPKIQTLEDLANWEHEIPEEVVDDRSRAVYWGWLPSVAHGEKSLRDFCVKVLKVDPPEGITGMALLEDESMGEFKTAGVEFYLPEPGFEKFYTEFLKFIDIERETMKR